MALTEFTVALDAAGRSCAQCDETIGVPFALLRQGDTDELFCEDCAPDYCEPVAFLASGLSSIAAGIELVPAALRPGYLNGAIDALLGMATP